MFRRIYIHIPFCREKCSYCSFVSRTPRADDLNDYTELLLCEMALVATDTGDTSGELIDSIYFGGGTPSLLSATDIARLTRTAGEYFPLSRNPEITLEANPGTVERVQLEALRESGINRLSLGIQSFDNKFLKLLGRIHSVEQGIKAFSHARLAGFGNIGIDLIHALPGQTIRQWHDDLLQAVQLYPEHISIYGLTIENGTPFADRFPSESPELPDDDISAEMFELADDLLTAAGYEHYEIANYALPDFRSRHNSGYWQRDGYLGLGVAAHSLLKSGYGVRFNNANNLDDYRVAISGDTLQRHALQQLTREDAMAEFIFLGLRQKEGINAVSFNDEFGLDFFSIYGTTVEGLVSGGFLQLNGNQLRLTRYGMLLSNQIFSRLLQ